MNMNRTIHFLSTSRTALILLLAALLNATAAQTAGAEEGDLTDFVAVSSQGTATARFTYSDHFYRVDWSGINTSQTTSVLLCYNAYDRLRARKNNNTKSDITLYASASDTDYWTASHITGLTPGQSSDGYTTYGDLAPGASFTTYPPTFKKVCTVTCLSANAPTWNWSADRSTCTATFTCTDDASLTATVAATVTRSGSTATASATFNGTNYTDTKTIVTYYDITYVLNGGTNAAGNPTTYADNVGVASFANPTRTGYTFAGWYDNASFTGSPVTNIPAGSSGNMTLYAKWNIGLTYNTTGGYYEISAAQDLVVLANYVNDGNNASGMTFKQTQDIDMSSAGNFEPIGSQPNSYNPTPFNGTYDGQGHAIIGLTVNTSSPYAGLFGRFEGGSVRNLTMVNPNVTSNDNSQGSKYAGGIVGNIKPGTIENCNVINPTLNPSSADKGAICGGIGGGYCVVTNCYYYTTTNYDAVAGNPQLGTITNTSRTYTLTLNDGITTSTAPAFSYGGTGYYVSGTTITLGGLSDRTGYTSDYAASGNVTVTDNQFAMPDGDVTVTAVYTPITYTITYHAGEGVEFSTDKNAYTVESATITLDQPSPKTGYTFSGWYGNAGLTGDAIAAIATGSTDNMELWAKWTPITYTVHFEPVIPVNGTMADQTFTYDQASTALTKNAFSTTTGQWLRWNTEADGSGTGYEDEALVQNLTAEDGGVVTLYAQWRLTHRFIYDNTIFRCYKVDTPNEVHRAYAGETVKVEVIDGTSEYTIRVVNGDGEAITLDTEANTFVMPNEEVWITYTSVKKMAYTTISLDNFESGDVAYLYDASQPTVTPTVVVKDDETVLTEGTDYTVEITNNTGSATQMVTATVTVTGMGGYVGTNTRKFRITPFNIATCDIRGTLEAYDDGYGPYYPLSKNVQVWNGNTQLTLNTDYTIELDPNIGPYEYVVGEQYQATVKGTGDWGGSQTFQFKVVELHHTVVFVANGGSGTMASDVATKDQHYTLPACGFTAPNGKKFDHWEASCEPGVEKQPGDYFTAPYIWSESDVQTITVTAYWRDKATYTVTLPEEMEVVSGTLTDGKAIEDEVITFRPRPGFTATDVQANGTALTPDGEGIYTLTITADVTVTATFLSTRQPVTVAYINEYGTTRTAQAIALDGHEAVDGDGFVHLAAGTYYVCTDITYANQIVPDGDITLILANRKTMTINVNGNMRGIYGDYNLTIYGQSLDAATAGTLTLGGKLDGINVSNYVQHSGNVSITTTGSSVRGINADVTLLGGTLTISAKGNTARAIFGTTHSILGGQLTTTTTATTATATGIYASASSGTAITLGWIRPDDRITASSISTPNGGTVAVADGQTLTDESGHIYTGTLTDEQKEAIAGKTLRPAALAQYIDANGQPADHTAMILDGTETNLAAGWYYVGNDISYNATLTLDGDVHLILADGKTMNVTTTGEYDRCIYAPSGQSLHIYGQSEGTGVLNAQTQGDGDAVIKFLDGTLAIHGGNVEATLGGTYFANAIHIARATAGDALVIDRGTLTATANKGIGIYIDGGDARINGGQVAATGTSSGIGIRDHSTIPGTLTLSGGTLTASGFNTHSTWDYAGTLAVASGHTYTDGTGLYDSNTATATLAALGGKTLQPCLDLADAAANTAAIDAHAGKTLAVALSGRTLYKDGSWNTLCLPFSISTASGTLSGDNVQAMTLNTTTSSLADGTLTLNFEAATTIPAGTPFIIKWDESGTDITNPVFEGVTISNATNDATVEGVLTFTGTYAPVSIADGGDNTKLYLGAANKLYYPTKAMTIGTHRAYFQLADGITAGEPVSGSNAKLIRAFNLNFGDDEATGIISVHDSGFMVNGSDAWYTLDGRRLDGQPTAKGLYIHGGKKVAIK